MSKGAILCKGHTRDGPTYWLHPSRLMVRADLAERITQLPGVKAGRDGLFDDASQTWKLLA
jgi:hypothetical protein